MAERLIPQQAPEGPSQSREAQAMPTSTGAADALQSVDLQPHEFELLVLLADGELTTEPERRRAAELLLERSAAARMVFGDLAGTKAALHAWATDPALMPANLSQKADLSMVRGRVMTRLPAAQGVASPLTDEPLTDRQAALRTGWWALLRAFGFGKASLALGAAALAAVVLVVRAGQPESPALIAGTPAVASHQTIEAVGGAPATIEPDVIIEELEVDSGSVAVTPGSQPSQPTVIWHFQGQGEG